MKSEIAGELRTAELSSGSGFFYGWKYSHYFAVVEESDKTLRARCTLCPVNKKPLSTAHNTTSNLKKHLETVHKTTKLEAKDHGDESRKRKRESDDVAKPAEETARATEQKLAITNHNLLFNIRICS